MVANYQRRRLWGITEMAIDAFDALVAMSLAPGGCDEARQRQLLTLVLNGLVGDGDDDARVLVQDSPMRSGFPSATAAREWIVDLVAAAARQQRQPWWQRCDEDGDPAIHGKPFKRLRNRTALSRLILDRRIELRLNQQLVADSCSVVQGEVQAWEAGNRIPSGADLDVLARVLDLDRFALAGAETGWAVHRNELNAEQQSELDALFWGSDTKVPELADRFGLEGRSIHKLVTPVRAGAECQHCGAELVFTARDRRRYKFADCPTCRRTTVLDQSPTSSS